MTDKKKEKPLKPSDLYKKPKKEKPVKIKKEKPPKVKKEKVKYTSIGGQALIEGIMMRSPHKIAMATRMSDDSIDIEEIKVKSLKDKHKLFGLPLIRGVIGFIDSMRMGYSTLMKSAEKSALGLDDDPTENPSKFEKWLDDKLTDNAIKVFSWIASFLGIVLAAFLFMYLPSLLFNGLKSLVGESIDLWRAVFEGFIRIGIFILYIFLVSRIKEMRRVFQYHGAEHKTIFCFENKLPLTVENVKVQSRFHPRCGTSFIVVMLVIGMMVSFSISFFTKLSDNIWVWTTVKFLTIPILMALGYEFIKFAGKHDNIIIRILSAPGLWMQRLTTVEPDDSQIEVGIASFLAVLPEADNINPDEYDFPYVKALIEERDLKVNIDSSIDDILPDIDFDEQDDDSSVAKQFVTTVANEEFEQEMINIEEQFPAVELDKRQSKIYETIDDASIKEDKKPLEPDKKITVEPIKIKPLKEINSEFKEKSISKTKPEKTKKNKAPKKSIKFTKPAFLDFNKNKDKNDSDNKKDDKKSKLFIDFSKDAEIHEKNKEKAKEAAKETLETLESIYDDKPNDKSNN